MHPFFERTFVLQTESIRLFYEMGGRGQSNSGAARTLRIYSWCIFRLIRKQPVFIKRDRIGGGALFLRRRKRT